MRLASSLVAWPPAGKRSTHRSLRMASGRAIEDAARLAVAFGACLIGFSMLRELLISRTLFANVQLLMPRSFQAVVTPESTGISTFVASAPGAFILLGLLIAMCQALGMRRPEAYYHQDEQPVERARITGRLKSDRY